MRTGITSLADALASASVVLTAAIICAGAASADPSQQQDQFVELLARDEIPAMDNVPTPVARAHKICRELDSGATVYTVVDEEMNGIFEENPAFHQEAAGLKEPRSDSSPYQQKSTARAISPIL